MWNPFASERRGRRAAESIVPGPPGTMPPAVPGGPVHLPPEQSGGLVDPAAVVAARRPAGPDGTPVRSHLADVQLMGTTAVATITVTELSHDTGAHQLADLLAELT